MTSIDDHRHVIATGRIDRTREILISSVGRLSHHNGLQHFADCSGGRSLVLGRGCQLAHRSGVTGTEPHGWSPVPRRRPVPHRCY